MKARLTIVTGTRHRPESLSRFLASVRDTASVPTEVLIADASDEFDPLAVSRPDARENPNVVLVSAYHEKPRLYPNQGYDQLVRKATTEYVAFFNDDAEMTPGLDKTAVDFMDKFTEVGLGCLYWHDPGGTPYLQSFQHIIYPNFGIIRKSAGDKSGWFDTREIFIPELNRVEHLKFYGMDVGLCFKMLDAGFAVCGIPGTLVKHHREQDEERRQNNQMFVHGNEGQLAGTILYHLWGGLQGYQALREKAARFAYLSGNIDASGNVVSGLGS